MAGYEENIDATSLLAREAEIMGDATESIKPSVYNVDLLSYNSIKTDYMKSNEKNLNDSSAAMNSAKIFSKSTNGKNTLDKFRLTSAQILRRNRFQSVLKRPQSANISTTQNGAGIEFIVENSLQPHSAIPPAPRNSPDFTKEYDERYLEYENYTPVTSNYEAIKVQIPNTSDFDSDNEISGSSSFGYENFKTTDSRNLENSSYYNAISSQDGEIPKLLYTTVSKSSLFDLNEMSIHMNGKTGKTNTDAVELKTVTSIIKNSDIAKSETLEKTTGGMSVVTAETIEDTAKSMDMKKQDCIDTFKNVNSTHSKKILTAHNTHKSAYDTSEELSCDNEGLKNCSLQPNHKIFCHETDASANIQNNQEQEMSKSKNHFKQSPWDENTAVEIVYPNDTKEENNLCVTDDKEIVSAKADSNMMSVNSSKKANLKKSKSRKNQAESVIVDQYIKDQNAAKKVKAHQRLFKRVPFGVSSIMGTMDSDGDNDDEINGTENKSMMDLSNINTGWQTVCVSQNEKNYYELSLKKKSRLSDNFDGHEALGKRITKTIKTIQLNAKHETVEQRTVCIVGCAEDMKKLSIGTSRSVNESNNIEKIPRYSSANSERDIHTKQENNKQNKLETRQKYHNTKVNKLGTLSNGNNESKATEWDKMLEDKKKDPVPSSPDILQSMITISSDLGRPPSGSQLMKRKKLTSGVLKQPKMPENIPESCMESELNTAVGESNDDANCKCSRSPSKSSSRPQSSVNNHLKFTEKETEIIPRSRPHSAPVSVKERKYIHKPHANRAKSAKPVDMKPIEVWTRLPNEEEAQLPGVQWCRDLQDKLLSSGVDIPLSTLVRALAPPVGYTVGGVIYESSRPAVLPSTSSNLLHKPTHWFSSREKALTRKHTAELLDLSILHKTDA